MALVEASWQASKLPLVGAFLGDASNTSVALALVVGAVPVIFLLWRLFGKQAPEPMPSDGLWTLETLKKFNGVVNPLCLGVCGKVVDVSTSENIRSGEGYGALWAGADATYALATLSLKAEDANKLDYKMSDFTDDQKNALAGWYKHFTSKYTIVGRLQEYEGWDFSEIEEDSKSKTPFGAARTDGKEGSGPASPTAPAAQEQKGVLLKRGDRVVVRGCEGDREELNGQAGELLTYNPDKGGFEVKLDGAEAAEVFKPTQLAKKSED